jgi:hypothetical protein
VYVIYHFNHCFHQFLLLFCSEFLPGETSVVEMEYMRWQSYWRRVELSKRPAQVLDALKVSNDLGTYPCVTVLLRIFATLPVTTASSERSFSAIKYIKTICVSQ